MAFTKSITATPAVDLRSLTPSEVERRIIDSVRRYATHQGNWSSADKNTPFLGRLIGMGIESSNFLDITMAMERQFLTRMTRRIPADEAGSFRLAEGELGPLVILEGQDTFAATPGLAVKMLMDGGHMAPHPEYLHDLVGFPCLVVMGEGYRLHESLQRAMQRVQRATDSAARHDAWANVETLCGQARAFAELVADAKAVSKARREAYLAERGENDRREAEWRAIQEQIRVFPSGDAAHLDKLKSQETALRLGLDAAKLKLRIAEGVAAHPVRRNEVEEQKVALLRDRLLTSTAEAQRLQEVAAHG